MRVFNEPTRRAVTLAPSPEQLPCPACCPLNQTTEQTDSDAKPGSFICPITGEELSCPNCCPLNQK
jgi:hypothetical protein